MMKRFALYLFFLLVPASSLLAQYCPPNIDFEEGTLNNWQCFTGYTDVTGNVNNLVLSPSGPVAGRHEIISDPNARDLYGGFRQLCPYGGKYSVKLGNSSTGAEAEGISYTFEVPANEDTFSFTYFYAVVFENPGHAAWEQPRFFVTAYDVVSGQVINCASYNYISTGGIPGFKQSPNNQSVLYKDWSPASIQFAGLAGRTVRLEFKTGDCTLGGHFGYAYIDVGSNCSNILATAPYCIETNSVILNAPYGFQSYTWYNDDYSVVVGTGQTITLSPPPATTGTYHVDVVPYPGYGCRDTAMAVVTPLPVPDTPDADPIQHFCQNQTQSLLTGNPEPGNDLIWYTGSSGGVGSFDAPTVPTANAGTFNYYVSQKKLFGCEGPRKKIAAVVSPTPTANFSLPSTLQCLRGNDFHFSSTSSNLEDSSFQWDFGDQIKDSSGALAAHTYKSYGIYQVSLTVLNGGVCSASTAKLIRVLPQPTAALSYPTPICEKQTPISFTDLSSAPDPSDPVARRWWEVGGQSYVAALPPPYVATAAGALPVRFAVSTAFGCTSDTATAVLSIRHQPEAAFHLSYPLCNNEILYFTDQSTITQGPGAEAITSWHWLLDGTVSLTATNPSYLFTAGAHDVALYVQSAYGCKSVVLDSNLYIHPKPIINLDINDSCVLRAIRYDANSTSDVSNWTWNFDGGWHAAPAEIGKVYTQPQSLTIGLRGETIYGCRDTLSRSLTIYRNDAFAGPDTIAAMNEPVQLFSHADTNYRYTWSPATGLNDPHTANPVATWDKELTYELYSLTREGCDSRTRIRIRRFAGPELYVPDAFTPNGDGKNDLAAVFPVGIKSFKYFAIYDRWGRLVFRTTDAAKGWNGIDRGHEAEGGTYVYVTEATDYKGKPMLKKGTIVLIR